MRIPNPFMPDTPLCIATDTSQKLAIRFEETIKNYKATGKDIAGLKLIPLVCWMALELCCVLNPYQIMQNLRRDEGNAITDTFYKDLNCSEKNGRYSVIRYE